MIHARDADDDFAQRFPSLGRMPPLNTEAGRVWMLALIASIGGVDAILFDNVMSLIAGDQKDEVPWSDALPLVQALTAKRVGQVWLDHTGHNSDRQDGSSTKAWRFDSVAVMTPLPDDQRGAGEVAFNVSFDHPGKARRRTPANWNDFRPVTVRLCDDQWSSEPTGGGPPPGRLSPTAKQFYDALIAALAITPTPGRTTRAAWYAECVRTGLAEPMEAGDDFSRRDPRKDRVPEDLLEIKIAGLIGVDGEMVTNLRRGV